MSSKTQRSHTVSSTNDGRGCLLVFGLFWTSLLLMLDVVGFAPLRKQLASASYKPAPAVVLSSEVEIDRSGSSTSYWPKIRYQYQVDGRTFEGQRYRYFKMSSRKLAHRVVADHPAGKATEVYYDPKDVREVVLARGVEPNDFFFVLFLIPFHLAGFGLLWAGWPSRPSEAGFPMTRRLTTYAIKTHHIPPWISGLASLGCFSFALILVNGILLKMNLSWTVVAVELALLAALALQAAFSQAQKNANLSLALRLDLRSQTLAYREQRWNLSAIDNIDVEEVDSGDSDTANDFWLRLQLQDGTTVRVLKAPKDRLEQLANWLTQKLPL